MSSSLALGAAALAPALLVLAVSPLLPRSEVVRGAVAVTLPVSAAAAALLAWALRSAAVLRVLSAVAAGLALRLAAVGGIACLVLWWQGREGWLWPFLAAATALIGGFIAETVVAARALWRREGADG